MKKWIDRLLGDLSREVVADTHALFLAGRFPKRTRVKQNVVECKKQGQPIVVICPCLSVSCAWPSLLFGQFCTRVVRERATVAVFHARAAAATVGRNFPISA